MGTTCSQVYYSIGPINVLVPSAVGTLTVAYCFQGVGNLAGIIAIGVCYCLMTSGESLLTYLPTYLPICLSKLTPTSPSPTGMVSLPPMTITQLSKDPSEYGTRIGMGYTVASIGALFGSPLAGLTLTDPRADAGNFPSVAEAQAAYRGVWLVAGTNMAVSCALMVLVRFMVVGKNWKSRV